MLSIIVPVYRVSPLLLKKCIDSILAQKYTDIELILVDDGSPDDSGDICDMYASLDKRIVVYHKENGGVSSARNLGIDKARGEYISFVDADDSVSVEYFAEMLSTFDDDCTMVVSGYTFDYAGYMKPMMVGEKCSLSREEAVEWMLKEQYITWGPVAKIYKTSLLQTVRFRMNLTMGEDLVFNLEAMRYCNRVVYMPSVGYYYYQREDSAVHERFQKKHLSVIDAMEWARREIQEYYPPLLPLMTDLYIKALGSWCFRILKSRDEFEAKAFAVLQGKLRPFFRNCVRHDFNFNIFVRGAVLIFMLPTKIFILLKTMHRKIYL